MYTEYIMGLLDHWLRSLYEGQWNLETYEGHGNHTLMYEIDVLRSRGNQRSMYEVRGDKMSMFEGQGTKSQCMKVIETRGQCMKFRGTRGRYRKA